MSWMDSERLDDFCSLLHDEPGLDLEWRATAEGIAIDNLESDSPYDPYDLRIAVHDVVDSCDTPDAFFCTARTERPSFMVYASRDESTLGRSVSIQTSRGMVAVTMVHSNMDLDDIYSLVSAVDSSLRKYAFWYFVLPWVEDAAGVMNVDNCACVAASEQGAELVALQTKICMANRDMFTGPRLAESEVEERSEVDDKDNGLAPDLLALLANAPGPVQAVTVPAPANGVRCAATIMGGVVAIAYDSTNNFPQMKMEAITEKIPHARVVIVVSPRLWTGHVFEPYVLTSWGPAGKIHVNVSAVPTAHVASVIEEAVELAPTDVTAPGYRERFEALLTRACTHRDWLGVVALRDKRAQASRTIAHAVDKNLANIKARLWRPEGFLATTMFDKWALGE